MTIKEINGKIIIEMIDEDDEIKYWLNIPYHPKKESSRGAEVKYPYEDILHLLKDLKKILLGDVEFDNRGRMKIQES